MVFEIASNTDANILRIFVIRHGQTQFNLDKILQGHIDIDLNDTGRKQAELVGETFKNIDMDGITTSDLVRCQNTVKEITKHKKDIPVMKTYNFREREMGQVQGMKLQEALKMYGPEYKNQGEGRESFLKRVKSEWKSMVDTAIEKNYLNYGVCTHGGVITLFLNYLHTHEGYKLGKDLTEDDLKVPFNTSVSVIDINKTTGDAIIQDFGNTKHLGSSHLQVKEQRLR